MQVAAPARAGWQVFGVLMAGALVGVVGILPYVLTLLDRLPSGVAGALPSRWVLLPLQIGQSMVLLGAATALGLWLGPKVGLGAPLLYGLVAGDPEARSRARAVLLPSAVAGALVGVVIVLLDLLVFAPGWPPWAAARTRSSRRPGRGSWPPSTAASPRSSCCGWD